MLQTNYCTVKQNMGVISEDAPGDSDRLPDFTKINGKVTFVPTTAPGQAYQLFDEEGNAYTVPVGSIEADIIDGRIFHEGQEGVPLFAAGKNANPEKIVYRVTYSGLRAGRIPVSLNSIYFEAIPGAVIDLTAVTPVPGAPVAGTIKGDKGDKGDTGPKGATGARGATGAKGDKGDKGDPGEVTLEQLSQAIRVDTSVGTRVFSGYTMIYGDTGRRVLASWDAEGNITGNMPTGLIPSSDTPGHVVIRRENNLVTLYIRGAEASQNTVAINGLPLGYTANSDTWELGFCRVGTHTNSKEALVRLGAGHVTITGVSAGDKFGNSQYHVVIRWAPDNLWPGALIGTDPLKP